jgi:hypothetical protein
VVVTVGETLAAASAWLTVSTWLLICAAFKLTL